MAGIVAPLFAGGHMILLTQVLYMAILGLSLHFLVAHVGLVSFGHSAMFGLGAYTAVYLGRETELGLLPIMLLSMLAAAILAGVMAAFVARVSSELFFALLTLSFASLAYISIDELSDITGGEGGLTGMPVYALLGDRSDVYVFALLSLAGCMLFVWALARTSFGWHMHTIREDPIRAAALRIPVTRVRVIAFTISGAIAGLAGVVAALAQGGAFPSMAHWTISGEALLIAAVGGMSYLGGPLVGAGILVGLEAAASEYTTNWSLYMGIIMVLIVLLAREGVVGLAVRAAARVRHGGKKQ